MRDGYCARDRKGSGRTAERLTADQLAQRVRDVKPHFTEDDIRGKVAALREQGLLKSLLSDTQVDVKWTELAPD